MLRIAYTIVAICLAASEAGLCQANPQQITSIYVEKPVSMDRSASELFVLSGRGYVYRLSLASGLPIQKYSLRSWTDQQQFEPVEILFTEAYGQKSLFASGNISDQFTSYCIILHFTLEGSLLERIPLKARCAGMDYDYHARILYIASSDQRLIYRVALQQKGTTPLSPIAIDSSIAQLGPLIVDSNNHRLFVSDVGASGVYEFDVEHKAWQALRFQNGPVHVDSLSLDPSGRQIYLLSSLDRELFVVPIFLSHGFLAAQTIPLTTKVATAIATLGDGRLAVAQMELNEISILAQPNGSTTSSGTTQLELQSVTVYHNGLPRGIKWHFDVLVNGKVVAKIPEYNFESRLKQISVNTKGGLVFPSVLLSSGELAKVEIQGYGPPPLPVAKGNVSIDPNGNQKAFQITIKTFPPAMGHFEFYFLIRNREETP